MGKSKNPGNQGNSKKSRSSIRIPTVTSPIIQLSGLEKTVLVIGTALGIASLPGSDPWLVGPMLVISELAFLWLFFVHAGSRILRLLGAITITIVLSAVAVRLYFDSRPPQLAEKPKESLPIVPPSRIEAPPPPQANSEPSKKEAGLDYEKLGKEIAKYTAPPIPPSLSDPDLHLLAVAEDRLKGLNALILSSEPQMNALMAAQRASRPDKKDKDVDEKELSLNRYAVVQYILLYRNEIIEIMPYLYRRRSRRLDCSKRRQNKRSAYIFRC